MRRWWRLVLGGVVAWQGLPVADAGRGLPAYFDQPESHPHPDRPPARYLCDVGSAPGSRVAAQGAAFAAIGRQIRSEVRSRATTFAAMSSEDGVVGRVARGTRSEVDVQSSFQHAEYMEVVEARRHRGDHWVYACLDRERAVTGILAKEGLSEALPRALTWVTQAKQAFSERDLPKFSSAYHQATSLWTDHRDTWLLALSLAPGFPPVVGLRDGVAKVDAWATQVVRQTEVYVQLEGQEPDTQVADAVVRALRSLGVIVRSECEPGGFRLVVSPSTRVAWSRFGHLARLSVEVRLESCEGGGALAKGDAAPAGVVGIDPVEPAMAVDRLRQAVGLHGMDAALAKALSSALPLRAQR